MVLKHFLELDAMNSLNLSTQSWHLLIVISHSRKRQGRMKLLNFFLYFHVNTHFVYWVKIYVWKIIDSSIGSMHRNVVIFLWGGQTSQCVQLSIAITPSLCLWCGYCRLGGTGLWLQDSNIIIKFTKALSIVLNHCRRTCFGSLSITFSLL